MLGSGTKDQMLNEPEKGEIGFVLDYHGKKMREVSETRGGQDRDKVEKKPAHCRGLPTHLKTGQVQQEAVDRGGRKF